MTSDEVRSKLRDIALEVIQPQWDSRERLALADDAAREAWACLVDVIISREGRLRRQQRQRSSR